MIAKGKEGLVQVRADLCHDCPAPCALQRDTAFHRDICAPCPTGRIPADGDCAPSPGATPPPSPAGDAPPLPPAAEGLSPLRRRVRTYRRAGVLVGALAFLRRRDACRGCDLARRLSSHPSLYGCGGCTSCTGGPERILVEGSRCKRGRWPR